MSEKEEKDRGFKVTDRRMAMDEQPEPEKEEAKPVEVPPPPPSQAKPPADAGPAKEKPEPGEAPEDMGPIDFSQFILSLATSALIQMGETRHPDTGESFEDMVAAQQTIDIIDMLKVKTKGNLDAQEARLLDNILAELRMRFIKKKK